MQLFGPHNPSMNDEGVGEVELPANGPVGAIEYLLMDKDEQVRSEAFPAYQGSLLFPL